jgi:XapX domain-containing protein
MIAYLEEKGGRRIPPPLTHWAPPFSFVEVGVSCAKTMKEVILSLLTGMVVGFLFTLFRLPIPAPPALAGIAGIVGVYLGMRIFEWISYFWK